MKHTSLVVSIIFTLVVFSMSFVSGEDSGSLSLGITNDIYNVLIRILPNLQININSLHIVIRKSAHIFEYTVLATSWYMTFSYWNGSLSRVLGLGLLIAGIDESIQLIAVDRGPSIIDAIVFDFLPFAFISYLLWLLTHRKREEDIEMDTGVLLDLQNDRIDPKTAYKKLYKREKIKRVPLFKRAHFVKLKIIIPEEKGVNTFLRVLFFLPFPILLLRIILSFIKTDKWDEDDIPLTKREIMNLISHRGIKVKVNAKSGEKVYIKTI